MNKLTTMAIGTLGFVALSGCAPQEFHAMSIDPALKSSVFGDTSDGSPSGSSVGGSIRQPNSGGGASGSTNQPAWGDVWGSIGQDGTGGRTGGSTHQPGGGGASGAVTQPTSGPVTLPKIRPRLVCGPSGSSGQTLSNQSGGLIAVLYNCGKQNQSPSNCSKVETLTATGGSADLLKRVQDQDSFTVNAASVLPQGYYYVILFGQDKTPPASIGYQKGGQAIAPIFDSMLGYLDLSPTLMVDSSGKISVNTNAYNVVMDNSGGLSGRNAACSDAGMIDPLMIDFSGHGINLSSQANGILFDLTGANILQRVSWPINAGNMFLVQGSIPASGAISGKNLFGNYTVGPDGRVAADGFAALKKYDSNRDGVISSRDAIYSKLRLWADANRNGLAEANELKSLRQLGVRSIDVMPFEIEEKDVYGNETTLRAVVKMFGGEKLVIHDVWFKPLN